MKTPKRHPATVSMYVSIKELFEDRARWKRKNRTARLKAKISRLTEQNKYLLAELRKTNEYHYNAVMSLAKMREEYLKLLNERKEQGND